ncbi:MAG: Gfo/Idh/MocA family oxidoreductase [Candidatus Saccharicenans sp.]
MKRREFLKTASVSLAVPLIVPSSVFARPAPSDRLQLGAIGVGRQGQANLMELLYRGLETGARVVAVCDLDQHRLDNACWLAEKTYAQELGFNQYRGVKPYHDFRELLARKDIDGVVISVPDFWHGIVAMAASRAGKDIYLEKPLTYSLVEGQKLVAEVRRKKLVLQTGSQQRSSIYFLKACEIVRNGFLGQLQAIKVWLPEDSGRGQPGPMPVPPNLDYEFWLGPAPEALYSEDRVHPQMSYDRPGWMQIEPYARGMITNWGAHMLDIAQWGHDSEHSGPVSLEASAEFPERGLFNVHTRFRARADYADGVSLTVETGDPSGVRFEGSGGWLFVRREGIECSNPDLLNYQPGRGAVRLYHSSNHMKNFLESMRSRQDPAAPVEVGHRSNSLCIIIHIAMKLGRKLHWDPEKEQFVNDEEANRLLDYPRRKPWSV